jgi:hypothetical protein
MIAFFEGDDSIESLLKILGGKIVYADGPYAKLGEVHLGPSMPQACAWRFQS